MCGRFTLTSSQDEIEARFGVTFKRIQHHPRFNVAPSQAVPTVTMAMTKEVTWMRWGLRPPWWRELSRSLINIRAESFKGKPLFKRMLAERRCLLFADGYYEWDKRGKTSQPYYFMLKDLSAFAFPGVWEEERDDDGKPTGACALVTTAPNALAAKVHDRMPAILTPDLARHWIDPQAETSELLKLLIPFPAARLECYPVSRQVNAPVFDGPELIQAIKL